ncbi:MAG TPA: DNA mismatch repair endonuclease MutL, partial [Anaerolineales bacterium]|nr:DNA mismatch repair endonuclease MutL [Anaerolineales bacterium]
MTIRILPPEVASQIAAGEVVERPASVVKELLENGLDAGARTIVLDVDGAGKRAIEVADDGAGISADELSLAVSRHATSKLTQAQDLFKISSLGFRGEALASIGSVSRLTITSRQAAAITGARLRVEAGQAGPVEVVGAPVGTLARVEDLFFNVPARLKFLKSEATERRQTDELVTRYALAYPQVRFHLRQEGKTGLQTSGSGDRREVLAATYGLEVARQLLEVQSIYESLQVTGFISPIAMTRSNRREITFFVNGRWIQDPALVTALVQAYHTMLMVGRYPLAALFLEIPPELVDVNVHPAKAEVRFRERDSVFSGVKRAVRRALMAYTPVPELKSTPQWGGPEQADSGNRSVGWERSLAGEPVDGQADVLESQEHALLASPQAVLAQPRVPLLRLVGQIAAAYLVAEGPDGLYLVDQHAAHERVLFERFMRQKQGQIPSQALLEPVVVELPPASARLLGDQLATLERIGFRVEGFGLHTFILRSIPELFIGIDPAAALRVLVENFEEDETPLQAEIEAKTIAR